VDAPSRLQRRYRDASGSGALAWAWRRAGRNAHWLRTQGPSRLAEEHELDPVRRTRTAVEKARWRRRHGVLPGQATAILLTGTPRSGTNMMTRGLAALPEVQVHNEGDRRAFRRYRLRSDEEIAALVGRSRHRFVLLKPLLDADRVPGLLDVLDGGSGARALWAYRDVDARARSALAKFGPSALVVLGEIAREGAGSRRWQARSMSPETLALLRRFDWDRLSPADGASLMWLVRNQLFFDQGLDGRAEALAVSYDAVVSAPVSMTRAICAHVGVTWRPSVCAGMEARSSSAPRLDLDPRVRASCEEMRERLDRAAAAGLDRIGTAPH
jgi:hypothetical protein